MAQFYLFLGGYGGYGGRGSSWGNRGKPFWMDEQIRRLLHPIHSREDLQSHSLILTCKTSIGSYNTMRLYSLLNAHTVMMVTHIPICVCVLCSLASVWVLPAFAWQFVRYLEWEKHTLYLRMMGVLQPSVDEYECSSRRVWLRCE